MSENWGAATTAYHEGRINFGEFAARTAKERQNWVGNIRRRLSPIPVWHAPEDSEQDFLLDTFIRAKKFDPARSTSGGFFRFGVRDTVGKRIQDARGVEKHRRRSEPRYEITNAQLGGVVDATDDSKNAEQEVLRSEYYEILRGLCDTPKQLAIICALQATGGSLAGATTHLYSDPTFRITHRISSEREVTLAIDHVVDELISAYGKEEAHK